MQLGSILTAAALTWAATATAQTTVVDVIVNSDVHNTLETAVITAGLDDDLAGEGPFTVFAPTDAAFDALEASAPGTIAALLADTAQLQAVLLYHVLGASVAADDIPEGQSYANSLSDQLSIQIVRGDEIVLNAFATVSASVEADNGIVHVIDRVIIPLSVADVVRQSPAHQTLEVALDSAGFQGFLSEPFQGGDLTFQLWAPSDEAFGDLPDGAVADLLEPVNRLALQRTLLYHLLIYGSDLATTEFLGNVTRFQNTASDGTDNFGFAVQVRSDGEARALINEVPAEIVNIRATNGVVFSIGQVLTPLNTTEFIALSPSFNTLEAALEATDLDGVLAADDADVTLVAPIDAAFAASLTAAELDALIADPESLTEVLLYHVIDSSLTFPEIPTGLSFQNSNAGFTQQYFVPVDDEGNRQGFTIDNIPAILSDLKTTNGLLSVLGEGILTPPSVVDIAVRSPVHTTLVNLVDQAGLVQALDDPAAALTVFAPTDDAFAAVPASTLDSIVETDQLARVLQYHVLGQAVSAAEIVDGNITSATTLEGGDVDIAVTNGQVVLNGNVTVVIADVRGTNGIVHVVDGVLLPDNLFSSVTATAAEAGIAVGPIPADDYTVVTLPADLDAVGARLDLFDARGQVVRSQALGSDRERVELGDLSAGTYFMTIDVGGARYLQPLVVQ